MSEPYRPTESFFCHVQRHDACDGRTSIAPVTNCACYCHMSEQTASALLDFIVGDLRLRGIGE